jgi:hypothetical protein
MTVQRHGLRLRLGLLLLRMVLCMSGVDEGRGRMVQGRLLHSWHLVHLLRCIVVCGRRGDTRRERLLEQ